MSVPSNERELDALLEQMFKAGAMAPGTLIDKVQKGYGRYMKYYRSAPMNLPKKAGKKEKSSKKKEQEQKPTESGSAPVPPSEEVGVPDTIPESYDELKPKLKHKVKTKDGVLFAALDHLGIKFDPLVAHLSRTKKPGQELDDQIIRFEVGLSEKFNSVLKENGVDMLGKTMNELSESFVDISGLSLQQWRAYRPLMRLPKGQDN
jgi:hypothetical protein